MHDDVNVVIVCAATGAPTVTYVADQEGDPNEDESISEWEKQYWIKWKGWAHIHNTWESESSLRLLNAGGMKRLENYQKKEAALEERFDNAYYVSAVHQGGLGLLRRLLSSQTVSK